MNRGRSGKLALLISVSFFCLSASQEPLLQEANRRFKPVPAEAPLIKDNPSSPAKVALGRMLFFDPRLSATWTISCNSCHNIGLGGVDRLEASLGYGWRKGNRNSPTVFNAVFNVAQFWDGRAKDLREQAKTSIQSPIQMNNTAARVILTLKSIPGYVKQFGEAYPGQEDPVTLDNVGLALELFESTLLTPGSRFDNYLAGSEMALNAQEIRGLGAFISKGCVTCHNGVNLGGTGFYRFGIAEKPDPEILPVSDKGRIAVTNAPDDEHVFKVPMLRNIALTPPYFHSGKVWDLKRAVAIMGTAQLGVRLSDGEIDDITAFLQTLTGKQPIVEYPLLPPHTSTTPLPEK